ncbi:MAG TPA: 2Fe-2S iron-sulfur cluster-binding protein [Rhodanobacteraceae bacterium]|jgi:sarcosine oxidase subunit alpha|nr:2Fe-2S iron-sulfur cluster-binding protein [Rhodanobacteraceae bacterium]
MSGPQRVDDSHGNGRDIDRSQRLDFSFDGQPMSGVAGDTIASALLANGVRLVGRSFKYHRPRGIFTAGGEEPNAIVDLRHAQRHDPNARATMEPLQTAMTIRSTHARGTAQADRLSFFDRFARFIPAGFYYKTFMWPRFRLYESMIRSLAGIGRVDAASRAPQSRQQFLSVDLCVIGGGAAGIAAALAGTRTGRKVLLVDERAQLGGSQRWREAQIDGDASIDWVTARERDLRAAGVCIMTRTTAIGLYDHKAAVLVEKGLPSGQSANGECLWQIRATNIVLATGAIERPLLFGNNDRPGVMLADAALHYLRCHAVRCGERVVVATNNDSAYELAHALNLAGAHCTVVDSRAFSDRSGPARAAGIDVHFGDPIDSALGRTQVEGARLMSGKTIEADLIAVAGGWTPLIHLYCHARGKPRWDERIAALVPGDSVPGLQVVGAANGARTLDEAIEQGTHAGNTSSSEPRTSPLPGPQPSALDPRQSTGFWGGTPDLTAASGNRRVWVDLQHDVTAKDIELAVRENFASVEHLKRYTTLGMATDQGKTSNVNGLAILAAQTGRGIDAVGVTTFRPPFVPVSMATIAGKTLGELQVKIRRLPAECVHREDGAYFREYGNLLRPAWYGRDASAIAREYQHARNSAAVFDASSLGKIEVIGTQAAALLDFIFYTRMSTLEPGRLRYGLALAESGAIFDDGVVLRLAPDHFVVSCSSGHVAAMVAHLEEWRQDRFDLDKVFIHDASAHWATMAVSGPHSKRVVDSLDLGVPVDDLELPHMSARNGTFAGRPARIARVSFTGERCYEISVPAGLAAGLWRKARAMGAEPIGVETLGVLRCEKGYIFVGQDTDSETMPHDIGMGGARDKREDAYVGDRSLFTSFARRAGRKQLVGIAATGDRPIPVGAHPVAETHGKLRSIGYVTSSCFSPALGRPIALGLVENGRRRLGEELKFEHFGTRFGGTLVGACFLDLAGARLHA